MDDTDFDLLCKGLTPDEAKRLRKLFREWSGGDEDGFLVQLALLTKAQWKAAAAVPQAVNDSRKLIERHLAEYRQQTAALVNNLAAVADDQTAELKTIVTTHAETVNRAGVFVRQQLSETEEVARRMKTRLEASIGEWLQGRDDFARERVILEKERRELAARVQWRDHIYTGLILFGAVAFGMLLEYYRRH